MGHPAVRIHLDSANLKAFAMVNPQQLRQYVSHERARDWTLAPKWQRQKTSAKAHRPKLATLGRGQLANC
jgi:hypothetical protein